MRQKARRAEDFRERLVADAQPDGESAERRHHGAFAVAGKTPALYRATAGRDPRLRMQMAGDLAGRTGGLMTKRNPADRNIAGDDAAERGRQRRIVIARDPDPVAANLQGRDRLAIRRS